MIFLDALSLHSGGARTHLRELLRRPPSGIGVSVLAQPSVWNECAGLGGNLRPIHAPEATRGALRREFWRRIHLESAVRATGATLYWDPAGGLPPLPVARVTMVRNMLPFDRRAVEWYGRWTYQGIRLNHLRRSVSAAVAASEGAIFISDWSRRRVGAAVGRAPAATALIPHGVRKRAPAPAGRRETPRILYVSDVEPYKRQIEAVLAYDMLTRQGLALGGLTLVGRFTNPEYESRLRALIAGLPSAGSIELTGWLDAAAVDRRIDEADILLFASSVECCPNILLEYLGIGKPIVCSREAPMEEFAEDAVVYMDPADPASIAAGLRRAVRADEGETSARRERALTLAARYDWDETARRTWEFLAQVAATGRRAEMR